MMGIQWVWGLHLIFLSIFLVATTYTCLAAQNSTIGCHERERLALLEFKHSVKDDFKMLSSWVGIDCCSWKGVLCDASTGSVASIHLRENYVASFYYNLEENYYIVGEKVNAYLAELRHLKHLDLSGNCFKGSQVPEFIGSFKQLSYLNLSNAGFRGIIPHHVGNLSNLKVLDLSSPSMLSMLETSDMSWVSGLSSLEHLDLSEVFFSQPKSIDMVLYIPPSLTYLSLRRCGLSNTDIGLRLNSSKILPNIKHLDLGDNNFKGQLPRFIQNMTSLTFLDLSYYNLSLAWSSLNLLNMMPSLSELHLFHCELHNAPFLPTFFNSSAHSNIQYLELRYNSILGRFPSDLMNMTTLRVLYLYGNSLTLIPESLGRLTNLRVLDLGDNSLTGSIPKALQRLRSLEVLDLSNNNLTGSIPTFLRKLTQLDLSRNQFNGSIRESLGRLTSLTRLNLDSNRLTGPIPTSIGRLSSLRSFSVSSNLLNGTIPISVGQLTKLSLFNVSYNSLEGVVLEAHFANLSLLSYFDTTSNYNLIFNVSNEWIPPFQLRYVLLSSCKIGDEIPQWLRTQRNIKYLELSNASLHGLLPTWLLKMPIIPYLDLSHNKLSGPLINLRFKNHITSFEDYFQYLFLQDNLFNGSVPRSLCRSTYLELLDVSRNRLSGNIPKCVGNLQQMKFLMLSSNGLSGALPSSIGNISSLEWLKLSDNNFSGELPQDLCNLRYLRVLDLGNNGFSGSIPTWIRDNIPNLMVMRLHRNNFMGDIPQSLCKCSNLHILDVAHNNLTGSIPHCFGELSRMIKARYQGGEYALSSTSLLEGNEIMVMKGINLEYTKTLDLVFNMDLSSNKLTGQIPREITTLDLLVGLNLSHNHLSGSIPDSIGNMKALNSLDFSNNQFNGTIPPSMADLNFLSYLNLSHNNLSGPIPTGSQLQTLTDPSIYAGNRYLCGAPLPNNCSRSPPTATARKRKYEDTNEPKKVWFYLDIMCGFATGLWGIIGVLSFKKQWRQKLFMIADDSIDKIYVAVAVRASKIKRGREAN